MNALPKRLDRVSDATRLLEYSQPEPNSGCWLWTHSLNIHGYAQVTIKGGMAIAHRLAYKIWIGPVPEGAVLHHRCHTRSCINPDHLEPMTQRQHVKLADCPTTINANKTVCLAGHPLEGANLRIRRNGDRICRECHRRRVRESWRKMQALKVQARLAAKMASR